MPSADTVDIAPITVPDTALVLEGGGMRASYTSAVIAGLLREGIRTSFVSGISAGATMATGYVAQQTERLEYSFRDYVKDPKFGGVQSFIRGKGYFHAEYIYEMAGPTTQPEPFSWERYKANPARCMIGAVRASDGEDAWWGQEDCDELNDVLIRIRASSTVPLFMPPPIIDGEAYFDGAMGSTGGVPLPIAQVHGYEKFLIVLTRTREYRKAPIRWSAAMRRLMRKYPAMAERMLTRHIRYNEMRERIDELERAGNAYVFIPDEMPVSSGQRNLQKLTRAHELGRKQFQRELPAIREFLGVQENE